MKVLMVGVDDAGRGGMWTVVENYLENADFCEKAGLCYIPTATAGSALRRIGIFLKALPKIRRKLKHEGYDILHMHMSERASVSRKAMLQRMAKKAGCKTVIHMHGADFEQWYKEGDEKRRRRVRKVLGGADKVLILGKYWSTFIGGLMDAPSRMAVLYNAVRVPGENSYDPKAQDIMFLGAMIERKGILDLLQAMDRIRDKLPKATKLVLCGDDPDGVTIPAVEQLKLADRVETLGWIDAEQKQAVMRRSAVNVLPSYREGLPMTILETMANGIPNVTTDVAAIPEAVTDGENGVLLRPGDVEALAAALLGLMDDEALRRRLSANAYDRMRADFSLESHLARLLAIYGEVLAVKG